MVSHGVLSWISPANRQPSDVAIARRLKPGGLVYLSYNVTTGWTAMVPVQALMRMLALASPERTDRRGARRAGFHRPAEAGRRAVLPGQPGAREPAGRTSASRIARYIAHEYLNQDWHPLMFADIAGEMAEAKCRYIGSATLAENIDTVAVPANVAPMLAETRDPICARRCATSAAPRRSAATSIARASRRMPAAEQQALLETLTLAGLGMAVPEGGRHLRHARSAT